MSQKYQLINIEKGYKFLCEKVTESGTDYFVTVKKEQVELDKTYYESDNTIPIYSFTPETLPSQYCLQRVIATMNQESHLLHFSDFSSAIPQIIDEMSFLSETEYPKNLIKWAENQSDDLNEIARGTWQKGYKKHAEKYTFSEDDLIEFHKWAFYQVRFNPSDKTTKELLSDWKSQKPKVIYFKS